LKSPPDVNDFENSTTTMLVCKQENQFGSRQAPGWPIKQGKPTLERHVFQCARPGSMGRSGASRALTGSSQAKIPDRTV